MNSLYLDKRNFFNCKLYQQSFKSVRVSDASDSKRTGNMVESFNCMNLMSSHNRELRQQRIREMELATPKIKFEYQEVVENHARDMEIERFAANFLRKKNKNSKRKSTVWENRYNLRIAYQQIQDWKLHYFAIETDLPLTERKRKITFSL